LADALRFDRADLVKIFLAANAPLAYDALFTNPPGAARQSALPREEAQEVIDKLYALDEHGRAEVLALLRQKFDTKS